MKKFLIFFLFAAFAWVPGLRAETSGVDAVTEVVDLYSTPEINYQETSKKLQKIEDLLKSGQVPIQKMSDEVRFLEDTRGRLMSARKSIDQELKFVQKRIDALGEAPEDGSQELAIIAQKREEFSKEDAYQKGKLAEADILLTKIDELNALILDIRNRELLGSLITNSRPFIIRIFCLARPASLSNLFLTSSSRRCNGTESLMTNRRILSSQTLYRSVLRCCFRFGSVSGCGCLSCAVSAIKRKPNIRVTE